MHIPSKRSFHVSRSRLAAAAVLGFDSDDSGADWEGFVADDLPQAATLDGNDIRLSDIEVSSVNNRI